MVPDFKESEVHIHISSTSNDETIRINLFAGGLIHELNRPVNESAAKTLVRIEKAISKVVKKNSSAKKNDKKKSKGTEVSRESTVSVAALLKNGSCVDPESISNIELSEEITIAIDQTHFKIVKNPPNVESVTIFPTRQYFVGVPVVATAISKYDSDEIQYTWFIENPSLSVGYTFAAEGRIFVPMVDHLGCKVKLYCTPIRRAGNQPGQAGRSVAHYLTGTVMPPVCDPRILTFREDFIKVRNSNEKSQHNNLRVVTYNILAETFATNTYAQKILYRYCPSKFLDTDYRMAVVQAELLAYEADIICLQECDYKVFNLYFRPLFEARNYSCHHTCKVSGNQEGCALFIRNSSLKVIQYIDIPLKDYLRNHDDLCKGLFMDRPDVADILCEQLGSIVQVAVCERTTDSAQVVLVANTHLFYHKLASYVRLLQTHAIVEILECARALVLAHGPYGEFIIPGAERKVPNISTDTTCSMRGILEGEESREIVDSIAALALAPTNRRVAMIFAGDLNSTPSSAATEYMLK